jgi:hypothetical protein
VGEVSLVTALAQLSAREKKASGDGVGMGVGVEAKKKAKFDGEKQEEQASQAIAEEELAPLDLTRTIHLPYFTCAKQQPINKNAKWRDESETKEEQEKNEADDERAELIFTSESKLDARELELERTREEGAWTEDQEEGDDECGELFRQYYSEYRVEVAIEVVSHLCAFTGGHPGLFCLFARVLADHVNDHRLSQFTWADFGHMTARGDLYRAFQSFPMFSNLAERLRANKDGRQLASQGVEIMLQGLCDGGGSEGGVKGWDRGESGSVVKSVPYPPVERVHCLLCDNGVLDFLPSYAYRFEENKQPRAPEGGEKESKERAGAENAAIGREREKDVKFVAPSLEPPGDSSAADVIKKKEKDLEPCDACGAATAKTTATTSMTTAVMSTTVIPPSSSFSSPSMPLVETSATTTASAIVERGQFRLASPVMRSYFFALLLRAGTTLTQLTSSASITRLAAFLPLVREPKTGTHRMDVQALVVGTLGALPLETLRSASRIAKKQRRLPSEVRNWQPSEKTEKQQPGQEKHYAGNYIDPHQHRISHQLYQHAPKPTRAAQTHSGLPGGPFSAPFARRFPIVLPETVFQQHIVSVLNHWMRGAGFAYPEASSNANEAAVFIDSDVFRLVLEVVSNEPFGPPDVPTSFLSHCARAKLYGELLGCPYCVLHFILVDESEHYLVPDEVIPRLPPAPNLLVYIFYIESYNFVELVMWSADGESRKRIK